MNYRRFSGTELNVSNICYGAMRFTAKEQLNDEGSRRGKQALERALERGVNFIHSSYEYGTRWALSDVLESHPKRHELHHIIKVPTPNFDDDGRFDPAGFRSMVEEALRDLHTDRIDILQHLQRSKPNSDELRIPNIPAVNKPLLDIFEKLRDEGKVGYLTTFPYTPGFAAKALETGVFSGMVAYYNFLEMEMAEFFPGMEERNQSFLCIRPFMGGLLTDRRVDRDRLESGDRFQDKAWDAAYERLAKLKSVFGDSVSSWTDFAIRFALSNRVVASLIVSLNTVDQVDGVLDAAEVGQDDGSFEKALAIYRQHGPL